MGSLAFSRIQYGKELKTAHGTAVAATKMLPGFTVIPPADRKPVYAGGSLGVRVQEHMAAIMQIKADSIPLKCNLGWFQALPLLFSLGLKGDITPTEVTPSQADYKWDFYPSLTADNTPDSATLEMGDDVQAYEVEYAMCKSLKFDFVMGANAGVPVEATLVGKQTTPTTFTPTLTLPAQELMVANLTKIYIDPTWANVGLTQKTGLLREAHVELLFGVELLFHGAAKTIDAHRQNFIAAAANFVFEGNTDADVLYDAQQAATPKVIRIRNEGAQIGAGSNHTLDLDLYGVFEDVQPMGQESDGDDLHTALFHTLYDTTGAKAFQAEVITTNQTI